MPYKNKEQRKAYCEENKEKIAAQKKDYKEKFLKLKKKVMISKTLRDSKLW